MFNYEIDRLGGIKNVYQIIKIEAEINNNPIKKIIHKQPDWSKRELLILSESMDNSLSYTSHLLGGVRSLSSIRYARWRLRKELFDL